MIITGKNGHHDDDDDDDNRYRGPNHEDSDDFSYDEDYEMRDESQAIKADKCSAATSLNLKPLAHMPCP